VIGAAGVLTALVPGSMILMTASTLLANNVYRTFRPQSDDAHIAAMAKAFVPCLMLLAVYFTLGGNETIVSLLLMAYAFVTQLFPIVLASLMRNNPVTRSAAFASVIVGEATVAWVTITKTTIGDILPFLPVALKDLNIGIVGLCLNVLTLAVVTILTRRASMKSLAAGA
jgi:SSS family solute:Na+ symporter